MGGKKTAGMIIKEAWKLYKANYKTLLLTALIVYGSSFLLNQLIDQAPIWLGLYSGSGSKSSAVLMIPTLLEIIISIVLINGEAVALVILNRGTPGIRQTAQQFSENWLRYLGITLWTDLWSYLWFLLFIIPGAIKGLSYMLAPYLVIEYPEMTVRQSLKKSMVITKGYKGRLLLIWLFSNIPLFFSACFSEIMSLQHNTQYHLYITLYTFIVSLFLAQPFKYIMYSIAYLDIKKAAINKGLLPTATKTRRSRIQGDAQVVQERANT